MAPTLQAEEKMADVNSCNVCNGNDYVLKIKVVDGERPIDQINKEISDIISLIQG